MKYWLTAFVGAITSVTLANAESSVECPRADHLLSTTADGWTVYNDGNLFVSASLIEGGKLLCTYMGVEGPIHVRLEKKLDGVCTLKATAPQSRIKGSVCNVGARVPATGREMLCRVECK